MLNLPDRVSLDLRRYERQQHDAELEHRIDRPARVWEATEAVRDPEQLSKVLNDGELAAPLAELMTHFEALGYEISKLQSDHRIGDEALGAIKASASAIAKIERQLVAWQLGDD